MCRGEREREESARQGSGRGDEVGVRASAPLFSRIFALSHEPPSTHSQRRPPLAFFSRNARGHSRCGENSHAKAQTHSPLAQATLEQRPRCKKKKAD